jgi:hypothetical protein
MARAIPARPRPWLAPKGPAALRCFRIGCLLGIAILGTAGCQKLAYEKVIKLKVGDIQAFPISAPRMTQQVTVTVSSPGSAVDAFLVLEKDRPAVENSLQIEEKPTGPLAHGRGEELTLSATIPAKSAYSVIISGAQKSTDVKIKVTGQSAP